MYTCPEEMKKAVAGEVIKILTEMNLVNLSNFRLVATCNLRRSQEGQRERDLIVNFTHQDLDVVARFVVHAPTYRIVRIIRETPDGKVELYANSPRDLLPRYAANDSLCVIAN